MQEMLIAVVLSFVAGLMVGLIIPWWRAETKRERRSGR
jgi:hypothetical protein